MECVQVELSATARSAAEDVSERLPNPSEGAILSWEVEGTGTVFTYLSALLLPTEPWPTPISRGFQVQKLIQVRARLVVGQGRWIVGCSEKGSDRSVVEREAWSMEVDGLTWGGAQKLDVATGRCSGEMITEARRGDLVCVSLHVSTSDDVRNVRIEDWRYASQAVATPHVPSRIICAAR